MQTLPVSSDTLTIRLWDDPHGLAFVGLRKIVGQDATAFQILSGHNCFRLGSRGRTIVVLWLAGLPANQGLFILVVWAHLEGSATFLFS